MKAVRAAHVSKKNWKQELYNFFRQYRNTPHPSTGMSPFTLMFNRETRTKLPQIPSFTQCPLNEVARRTREALNEDKQHEIGSGHQKWRHRLDQKRNWEQINTGV